MDDGLWNDQIDIYPFTNICCRRSSPEENRLDLLG